MVHAAVLLLLVSERRWLKRSQNTLAVDEASIPTEAIRSDDDEVVAPLRLPAYLAEQNAIRRPAVDIDREGVPVQEAMREAVPTQEVNLGLVRRVSSVFPVLSRRVLDVRTWDTSEFSLSVLLQCPWQGKWSVHLECSWLHHCSALIM